MAAAESLTRIPTLVDGCDLRSLPLGPVEAFVVSRVDGATSEADLSAICGLDAATLHACLDRLSQLGAITFDGGPAWSQQRPRGLSRISPDGPVAGRPGRVAIANLLARPRPAQPTPDSRTAGQKHRENGDAKAAVGDWYGAAKAYTRAAADLPDDWQVRQKAALALVKASGDLHQAADLAKQAINLQTGRVEPRLVLAHVYLAAGLPNAVRRVLEGAEGIAPGDPRIAKLRSRID